MRACRLLPVLVATGASLLCAAKSEAQRSGTASTSTLNGISENMRLTAPDLEVNVKGPDGKPLRTQVMVQVIGSNGRVYDQHSTSSGQARFNQFAKNEFRVLVTAPGYRQAEKRVDLLGGSKLVTVDIQLIPLSDAEDAAASRGISALNPKTQKEVGMALEALRANKPNNALNHLQSAQKQTPNSADIEFLFGIYAQQMNDPLQAEAHWNNALTYDPKHLSTLLELSQQLLNEKKAAEAMLYLKRAIEVEPTSWRAHSFLAEAEYMQGSRDEAMREAQRALDLGHGRAAALEPFFAGMLAESGDTERAIGMLQDYVKANPADAKAARQLAALEDPSGAPASASQALATVSSAALPLPSTWMPADVDERVPPIEPGSACSMEEVLHKTGDQLLALIHDVDRFTATESVVDQTINKFGMASSPDKRKFSYLVSINEIRPGMLSVDEYRDSSSGRTQFPDGVITTGLPALVLIFHPIYAGNYDMTCEGLARLDSGLAWQVHFRQRADKPASIRGYRVGIGGHLYPAALRGRAWISGESFQVVRLETDLVDPMPQIRLVAEHASIEYGSVNFRQQNLNLWLPRRAEVYFDWNGLRVHRRHSFDNYLLFSVDENQRIHAPKQPAPAAASTSAGSESQ
jgi:tetratricopeptide (TPR) repeat protein